VETYDILIAVGAAVDVALLALVVLRVHASLIRTRYAAAAAGFILMNLSYVGLLRGPPGPAMETLAVFSTLLAHALVPAFVFSLPVGGRPRGLGSISLILLAVVPLLTVLVPLGGWSLQTAYLSVPVGVFLILCLVLALARAVQFMISGPLLSSEAYWVVAGIVALLNAGPGYAYELQVFGFPSTGGSNLATPIALATFAVVAFRTNPYITISRWRRPLWHRPPSLSNGSAIVFEEARPKYIGTIARQEARLGRPLLVLDRERREPAPSLPGVAEAGIVPARSAAARVFGTASEFLARRPGGLMAVKGLAAVAALSGWPRALQLVWLLQRICRQYSSTLLLTTSHLGSAEKEDLKALGVLWLPLPDPVEEIEAMLSHTFGSEADSLLDAFARFRERAKTQITTDDIPALAAFLLETVGQLSAAAGDADVTEAVRFQLEALVARLRDFQALTLKDLSNKEWPSRPPAVAHRGLLVKAAEFVQAKNEEVAVGVEGPTRRAPISDRARPTT